MVLKGISRQQEGTVKWFNVEKSFGFIIPDHPQLETYDVFVHYRSIQMEGFKVLYEGQRVSFTLTQSERGLMAQEVVPEPMSKDGHNHAEELDIEFAD